MRLKRLLEFKEWLLEETLKSQLQIEKRLKKIQDHSYFGDAKYLGDGLSELRWKSGRRVYFSTLTDSEGRSVLLILGGNKNGQNKDVQEARKLLSKYQAI